MKKDNEPFSLKGDFAKTAVIRFSTTSSIKSAITQAAKNEGISVNLWLEQLAVDKIWSPLLDIVPKEP